MRRFFLFATLIFVIAVIGLSQTKKNDQSRTQSNGQSASRPAEQGAAKTAEQMFKNIQSLKGVPSDELIPAMHYFNASLGVECNFCHVVEPTLAFEKDDKEDKKAAREMIAMTRGINKASFDGNLEVGCSTCHNGHVRPTPIAPAAEEPQTGSRPAVAQAQPGQQPQPPAPVQQSAAAQQLPTADQIIDAYQTAIGAKAALQKFTSMVAKGTVSTAQGTIQLELDRKAPNLYSASSVFPNGLTSTDGTDGSVAWNKSERGVTEMNGYPLRGMLIVSRFDRDLAPTANYATIRVVGTDTVNGHEVYVVRGTFKDPSYTERLFFDRQSGLLLRRITFQRTLFGFLQDISNFSDYRDVQGVKVPFTVLHSPPGQVSTIKFDKIEFNLPIDDSKFTRPVGGR
jgi:hypothetical protein